MISGDLNVHVIKVVKIVFEQNLNYKYRNWVSEITLPM